MRASAWILQLDDDTVAAVGAPNFRDFLGSPGAHPIPGAPEHCMHFTVWNDQVLPILDLAGWLNGGDGKSRVAGLESGSVVVLRYQTAEAEFAFGALRVSQLPVEQEVDDAMACELPPGNARYSEVALSCFTSANRPIPILDVNRLFRETLPLETVSFRVADGDKERTNETVSFRAAEGDKE